MLNNCFIKRFLIFFILHIFKNISIFSASDGDYFGGRSARPLRARAVPAEELRHVLHLQGLLKEGHDGHVHSGEKRLKVSFELGRLVGTCSSFY